MKISVIIPVYNASKYLKRCLDSIKNQTYSNWEAICVDDGSTDNSLDILNEYASKDSRFKVIAKSNGGVSDARNVGMDNVTGDYVMYVDSDDFIHHQTMELACAFVKRDGSDIISWYKDTEYSKKLKKHFKYEGCENDELLPSSFFKKYNVKNIRTKVTDDIFANVTEENSPWIYMPIKHFYVCMHLFKTDLIKDIKFIKGLKYEDFPWLCEVMLKNPKVTITSLRVYYYYYNPISITESFSKNRVKKMVYWLKGLEYIYDMYNKVATKHQIDEWTKNCKWPVIKYHVLRELLKMSKEEIIEIKPKLKELESKGLFDNCKGFRNRLVKRNLLVLLHLPIGEPIKRRRFIDLDAVD